MKRGDEVRIVHRDGTVEVGHVHMAGTALVHVRHDDGSLSYHSPRALGAMRSVLDAAEAVARARDAVVEAAKRQRASWESLPPPAPDYDDRVNATEEAVRLLIAAERAEAEARAQLEALR